ncbi:hypothetical protein DMH15_05490 [Streptomyces sp. WAC 06725]|nr:hypothetical protein DMH15_05490 [Streptomyces sp. WAC 06725]
MLFPEPGLRHGTGDGNRARALSAAIDAQCFHEVKEAARAVEFRNVIGCVVIRSGVNDQCEGLLFRTGVAGNVGERLVSVFIRRTTFSHRLFRLSGSPFAPKPYGWRRSVTPPPAP